MVEHSDFTVRDGIIRDPGKFEGEPIYVPYFYERVMQGDGDTHYDGETAVDFFVIDGEDLAKYPDLSGIYGLAIWETDQGFAECHRYDTQRMYDEAIADLDAPTGDDEDAR